MMMNKSNLNSARSESSKKTSISDDELEKSVYFPDVANVSDIDTLEPKNKTKFCSCYLKDKTNKLFKDYPNIFNSDLKKFFKNIASEDEKISTTTYFQKIFLYRIEILLVFFVGMVVCRNFALLCLKSRVYTQMTLN